MYIKIIKPFFDYFFALIGFIVLMPIFLPTALVLFLILRGNPFFVQRRPGLNGKIFSIVKFKTMLNSKDLSGNLLEDQRRIFSFGRVLRKYSIDEIPQIINVLIGDMSLIGPRPLLPKYLPLYSKEQSRRHEVKPGISGYAQVNGRNAISWEQKFKLDIWYVDNLSFWVDLKVLLLTIKKVIVKEGISSDTSATMEEFTGN